MLTVHCPQSYFDKNPFLDLKGKVGPTYVRPKEKAKPFRSPGFILPVGPSKWVNAYIIYVITSYFFSKITNVLLQQGGMHDGCFEKFPPHKKDKYVPKHVALRPRFFGEKKVFFPQSYSSKTMNTCSVLYGNVDLTVNIQNYKTYEPTYIRHLSEQ